jgi:FlgD Ig-like domain/WD40-like Beta Propeller Repeat
MNGMKKLLGVIGILGLAAAFLPVQGRADLRGAFAPLTTQSGLVNGAEQPALRPFNTISVAGQGSYEEFFAFSTRSLVPGSETVRSIYLHLDSQQAGAFAPSYEGGAAGTVIVNVPGGGKDTTQIITDPGTLGPSSKQVLLTDPSLHFSYADPSWSYDGKYLAYVRLDAASTTSNIYVQQYALASPTSLGAQLAAGDSGGVYAASVPVGNPILVVAGAPGVTPRHPNWIHKGNSGGVLGNPLVLFTSGANPDGYTLTFDSNATTLSKDIYTVAVFPTDVDPMTGPANSTSAPIRRTFSDVKAEQNPTWSPNGHDICYSSNQFGPNVLQILDTDLPSVDPGYIRLAETSFAFISHNNPSYTSDGKKLMYDAPGGEDPAGLTAVWLLVLADQTKCEIQLDVRADSDPDVTEFTQRTRPEDGFVPYNGFAFASGATGGAIQIWRGTPLTSCLAPLPMGVVTNPTTLGPSNSQNQFVETDLYFPAETYAAGFVMSPFNGADADGIREGVRMRASILSSPTLLGLPSSSAKGSNPNTGNSCWEHIDHSAQSPNLENTISCFWDRKDVEDKLSSLGLYDQVVPMLMTAYSNRSGRPFSGFAYIRLAKKSLVPTGTVALMGNSPNPFNPVTTIKFTVNKPGNVSLRIFDVKGALVKTLTNGKFDVGVHEATWDGTTVHGNHAASGVYYAKITGADNNTDTQRLVMAK